MLDVVLRVITAVAILVGGISLTLLYETLVGSNKGEVNKRRALVLFALTVLGLVLAGVLGPFLDPPLSIF